MVSVSLTLRLHVSHAEEFQITMEMLHPPEGRSAIPAPQVWAMQSHFLPKSTEQRGRLKNKNKTILQWRRKERFLKSN
jgi:hypothetical protein